MRAVNLEEITLLKGSHSPDSEFCIAELIAYIAEEEWSDEPKCLSPVIGLFLRVWNDLLDDKTRQRLKPYASRCIGTAGTTEQEERRGWIAIDWLVREYVPICLRLAGMVADAETLENLEPITSSATLGICAIEVDGEYVSTVDAAATIAHIAVASTARTIKSIAARSADTTTEVTTVKALIAGLKSQLPPAVTDGIFAARVIAYQASAIGAAAITIAVNPGAIEIARIEASTFTLLDRLIRV